MWVLDNTFIFHYGQTKKYADALISVEHNFTKVEFEEV